MVSDWVWWLVLLAVLAVVSLLIYKARVRSKKDEARSLLSIKRASAIMAKRNAERVTAESGLLNLTNSDVNQRFLQDLPEAVRAVHRKKIKAIVAKAKELELKRCELDENPAYNVTVERSIEQYELIGTSYNQISADMREIVNTLEIEIDEIIQIVRNSS